MALPIAQPLELVGGSYIVEDKHFKGGYRTLNTLLERNNIPLQARKLGMVVYVRENKNEYALDLNLSNTGWVLKGATGGGQAIAATTITLARGVDA